MTNLVKKTIMFLRKRMTDKELDRFLISTFKNILADTENNASYINSKTYKDYQEVQEDIDFSINELKELLQKIHSIDDLAECDDDQITRIYEYIEDYYSNYIIPTEPKQHKIALAQCEKLEELMCLFIDQEDFDDSEDDFED